MAGRTALASSLVVGVFFLLLAAGAVVLGPTAARRAAPWRLYAALEGGILLAILPAFCGEMLAGVVARALGETLLRPGASLILKSCLALAFVVGLTYVLLFKEIKAKHLGYFYARLPPLDSLDLMNARTVVLGWVCLTIGVIVGVIWTVQARQGPIVDPRIEAITLADPKILGAVVSWAIYTFALYARKRGVGGKRSAYISVIGFAIVLFNFVPIGYFLTRSHNFGG